MDTGRGKWFFAAAGAFLATGCLALRDEAPRGEPASARPEQTSDSMTTGVTAETRAAVARPVTDPCRVGSALTRTRRPPVRQAEVGVEAPLAEQGPLLFTGPNIYAGYNCAE